VLPLVQVAIAAALATSNALRPDSWASPTWTKPDWQLLHSINAPAALIAMYPLECAYDWFSPYHPLNLFVESIIRFSLIWLLWYVVSIEIGGAGQSVLTPKTRMREVADVLAIGFGAAVGVLGALYSRPVGGTFTKPIIILPYLIWPIVIMGFYGHDLWVSVRDAKKPAGS
jgi:hypothetical protein